MRVLVISQCTRTKINVDSPAKDMFTGPQHKRVMEGINYVWRDTIKPPHSLHLHILSAEYGLISAHKRIRPYKMSFSHMFRSDDIRSHAEVRQVHSTAVSLINKYDLVFYLLSRDYLTALDLPLDIGRNHRSEKYPSDRDVTQLFFMPPTDFKRLPEGDDIHCVPAGKDISKKIGSNSTEVKGEMFRRICYSTAKKGFGVFETIRDNPEHITEILDNFNKPKQFAMWGLEGDDI